MESYVWALLFISTDRYIAIDNFWKINLIKSEYNKCLVPHHPAPVMFSNVGHDKLIHIWGVLYNILSPFFCISRGKLIQVNMYQFKPIDLDHNTIEVPILKVKNICCLISL